MVPVPNAPARQRRKVKKWLSWEMVLWLILGVLALVMVLVNLLLESVHEEKMVNRVVEHSISKQPVASSEESTDPWKKKEQLIQIMKMADVNLTEEVLEALSSWEQVVDRFGPEPKILGLETCQAFNAKVPQEKRQLAPAGMFNSGTNLLFQLLQKNCKVHPQAPGMGRGIDWQVNWGKHQSPRFRFENKIYENRNNAEILPVVIVRDPYTWFQSMCKNRYSAHWYHIGELLVAYLFH